MHTVKSRLQSFSFPSNQCHVPWPHPNLLYSIRSQGLPVQLSLLIRSVVTRDVEIPTIFFGKIGENTGTLDGLCIGPGDRDARSKGDRQLVRCRPRRGPPPRHESSLSASSSFFTRRLFRPLKQNSTSPLFRFAMTRGPPGGTRATSRSSGASAHNNGSWTAITAGRRAAVAGSST